MKQTYMENNKNQVESNYKPSIYMRYFYYHLK